MEFIVALNSLSGICWGIGDLERLDVPNKKKWVLVEINKVDYQISSAYCLMVLSEENFDDLTAFRIDLFVHSFLSL